MRQSIAPKTEVTTKPWIATACGLAMTKSASMLKACCCPWSGLKLFRRLRAQAAMPPDD